MLIFLLRLKPLDQGNIILILGSRAFVEDHPEIVNTLRALLNQVNGTGRVVNIAGQSFQKAAEFIIRWLAAVPSKIHSQMIYCP